MCLDLTQQYAYLIDIIKLKHLLYVIIHQKKEISLLSTPAYIRGNKNNVIFKIYLSKAFCTNLLNDIYQNKVLKYYSN